MRLLIDSQFLCHRAKHSYCEPGAADKSGVILGFLNQVQQLAQVFHTNKFIFCWDSVSSVRKAIFPEYKIKEDKDSLTSEEKTFNESCFRQFDILRTDVLSRIGFSNIYAQPGYETDDLIAMIVKERRSLDWMMVTRDQDFFQLLNYADMYDPITKAVITAQSFKEKWGINPDLWAEVKAIAGCKSDKVPGVNGVAEKTAIKYLLKQLNPTSSKYKSIISGLADVERNRKLVSLPFPGTNLYKIKEDQFDFDSFYDVCNQYAMDMFLERRQLNWWRGFFEGFGYE